MLKWLRLVSIFIVICFSAWELHSYLPMLIQWTQGLGVYGFIGFFLLYCLSVLLFLPIEPIVLASGAMFGFFYGFLITLFSAVVSSIIAFKISRYFGFSWMPFAKSRLLVQWHKRIESFGWKSLAISRLTPFLPCSIISYGYGLTNMNLFIYTVTNLIFFIPYKLLITFIGSHL